MYTTNALRWDGKRHKIVKLYKESNLYYTSDDCKNLQREKCIDYSNYIQNVRAETSFKNLIEMTNSIKVIKFNEAVWENSQCSCAWWHKHLKCNHIITLAVRLNKASYIKVAYSAPIAHKRRRGQPKKTVGCLARQPDEFQCPVGIELPPSDEDEVEPVTEQLTEDLVPKKRGRPKNPEKATKKLGSPDLVRRSSKRLKIKN